MASSLGKELSKLEDVEVAKVLRCRCRNIEEAGRQKLVTLLCVVLGRNTALDAASF
jgi:hypothetical protein